MLNILYCFFYDLNNGLGIQFNSMRAIQNLIDFSFHLHLFLSSNFYVLLFSISFKRAVHIFIKSPVMTFLNCLNLRFSVLVLHLLVCSSTFQLGYSFQDFEEAGLKAHNEFRAKHKAPPLTLDENLNKMAQTCAEHYAKKKKLDYSCPEGKDEGQNMAQTWGGKKGSKEMAAKDGAQMWYKTLEKFDKKKPESGKSGSFTQLVWKSSERLGVGIVQDGDKYYVVAMYSPPGNMQGDYKDNVQV